MMRTLPRSVTVQKGIGVKIHYFRCSKGDFYSQKRVSDVERFGHSAKKNMRHWCFILIPPLLPTTIQVDCWQLSPQGQVWCARLDNYYPDRVNNSHHKGEALYFHETWGLFNNGLYCVQRWFRFMIEGSETRVFKDSEEKVGEQVGCNQIRCPWDSYSCN